MLRIADKIEAATVTSFAEVWIEISLLMHRLIFSGSLPSRKCGLKLLSVCSNTSPCPVTSFAEVWIEIRIQCIVLLKQLRVTSFAEVWIEMFQKHHYGNSLYVTSFAEVWIEIPELTQKWIESKRSLPSRKCGLKYLYHWSKTNRKSHFLRGSVD